MTTRIRLAATALGLTAAAAASLAWTRPAETFGPPFLSIELPANPLDAQTRGAAFTVHSYHHQHAVALQLTGTAEGIVDGRRRSIPVELTATGRPGTYAVARNWPAEGHWIIAISQADGVTLVVELGDGGGIHPTRYYGTQSADISLRSVRVLDGKAPMREINRALQSLALAN